MSYHEYLVVVILLATIIGLIGSFAVSLLIIYLYKRAIIKGMGLAFMTERSNKEIEFNQVNGYSMDEPVFVLNNKSGQPFSKTLEYKSLEKFLDINLLVHAISSLLFAATWVFIYLGPSISFFYFFIPAWIPILDLLVIFCWPFVFSVNAIWARGRKRKLLIFGCYAILVIVSIVLIFYNQDQFKLQELFYPFIVYNAAPSFTILLLRFAKIQTVSMTIFMFCFISALLFFLITGFIGIYEELPSMTFIPAMKIIDDNSLIAVIVIVLFSLSGAVLMILPLKRLYIGKYINEQQISIDVQLLIFSFGYSMWEIYKNPTFTTPVLCLLPFVIYKIISTLLYIVLKTRHQNKSPVKLLLLRVFALQDASRKMFQRIQVHWQFAGPVLMISGPDLATTTIDSAEMIDFVTNNLKNRFCHDSESIEKNLNDADLEPDNDGSFRVTEFFCRDNIWKEALVRLVCISNIVLFDLRGFSEKYKGCQYEIQQVVNHINILKVIVLIDAHTNIDFLKTTFINAYKNLEHGSTKFRTETPQVQLYYFRGNNSENFSDLLKLLCNVSEN
ncbi:hypothetical protein BH23BAC2_BH23BAC2_24320 [soil metagenome]